MNIIQLQIQLQIKLQKEKLVRLQEDIKRFAIIKNNPPEEK